MLVVGAVTLDAGAVVSALGRVVGAGMGDSVDDEMTGGRIKTVVVPAANFMLYSTEILHCLAQ